MERASEVVGLSQAVKDEILRYIAQIESRSRKTIEDGLHSLKQLRMDRETSLFLVEAGVIRPLLAILSETSFPVDALGILILLASNEAFHEGIELEGGIDLLIRFLSGDSYQNDAVYALIKLSNNVRNQVLIREKGGVEPLVVLLTERGFEVKPWVAELLAHLAENVDNQQYIADMGAIRPLVGLLIGDDRDAQFFAAFALGNLAQNERTHSHILEVPGSIQRMVELLEKEEVDEDEDEDEDEVREEAELMTRLREDVDHAAITRPSRPGDLWSLATYPSTEAALVRHAAFRVLRNLARNERNHGLIERMGGTELLSRLGVEKSDEVSEVGRRAARAIPEGVPRAEPETIERLVSCLSDDDLCAVAAKRLGELARNEENQRQILSAGAIRPLLGLLSSESEDIKEAASLALHKLSADEFITKRSDIIRLIRFLEGEDQARRLEGLSQLAVLSQDSDEQMIFMDLGMIELLVPFLSDEAKDLREAAVRVVRNLAQNANNQVRMASGVTKPLVSIMSCEDEELLDRRGAAEVLAKLASNPLCHDKMRGAVLLLVDLLSDRDREVRVDTIKLLETLLGSREEREKAGMRFAIKPLLEFYEDRTREARISGNDRLSSEVRSSLLIEARDMQRRVGDLLKTLTSDKGNRDHLRAVVRERKCRRERPLSHVARTLFLVDHGRPSDDSSQRDSSEAAGNLGRARSHSY